MHPSHLDSNSRIEVDASIGRLFLEFGMGFGGTSKHFKFLSCFSDSIFLHPMLVSTAADTVAEIIPAFAQFLDNMVARNKATRF